MGGRCGWYHSTHHGDPMNQIITLVTNRRVIRFQIVREVFASLGITIHVDGRELWSSEESGWRELGVGVTAGFVYFWSARRLVSLALEEGTEAFTFDTDEDIVVSFAHGKAFVIVCEASIRLVSVVGERARLELPEVIDSARWQGDVLEVWDADGVEHRVVVSGGKNLDVVS